MRPLLQILRRSLAAALLLVLLDPAAVHADAAAAPAELKQKTAEAFHRYIRATEARIDAELADPARSLYPDRLVKEKREELYARLKRGELVIEKLETSEDGEEIPVPDGMIHHWVGVIFIPGVSIEQVLALVQDYDNTEKHYAPDVVESKLLARDGDHFRVFMRMRKKKVITVVVNTTHDIRYRRVAPGRPDLWFSRSEAVRIAQVENPGEEDERELPVGNDGGYLWRLNAYWRFAARDGGVYVESEAVTLSRDVPFGLGWLIGGFVKSVPRESLEHTLVSTRRALISDE